MPRVIIKPKRFRSQSKALPKQTVYLIDFQETTTQQDVTSPKKKLLFNLKVPSLQLKAFSALV